MTDCQKVPYSTREAAQADAKLIKAARIRYSRKITGPKSGRKIRVYLCRFCRVWHLTTAAKRPKRRGKNKG